MKVARLLAALAVIAIIAASSGPAAAQVNIYVGYLNNLSGAPNPADIPNPFDPGPDTTLIASGDSASAHDTGVIQFENVGANPISIDPGVQAVTQGATFQIWDAFLPFVLGPGMNLVLAETANFNFDSSDFGLGVNPVVNGSINGLAFSCEDVTRVLLGHEEAGNTAETTPYALICTQGVPEPGTLSLLASGGVGLLLFARKRRATVR